ncbi:Flp pilus assembly protein TadG [Micromonospora luteifusca]|uniref:Flp pilus assembly protein TadG n=1 Tax=Micromonospora luteifusca TaxID=709860 RepID=A0ABS2LUN1_9ACTN|nr:TadE family protein [Micromonospora luteifusca]MBM7491893.1 Flp pilus assembly protein TadG [Micromonospora luteifusca]
MSRATYPRWHRTVSAARRRLAGGDRERGANPVELAVLMPLILVLLFASVQIAAVFLARSTALNAAQSGVNAQRPYQARNGAGVDRATRFLNAAGGWLVGWQTTRPTCAIDDTDVTCTVRGRSLSVIPGVDFAVQQTAHGTVERLTPP